MKPITTVLFDFDGTIMNTNDVIIESWQHLFRTVEGKERPLEDIYQTMGEPLYVTMEKIIPGITVEEGVTIYRSFMIENFFKMIQPFPGMPELLETLKEKNYKTGLVTSRIGHTTRAGLDEFGLLPFFVVTVENVEAEGKPVIHPSHLLVPERSGFVSVVIVCVSGGGSQVRIALRLDDFVIKSGDHLVFGCDQQACILPESGFQKRFIPEVFVDGDHRIAGKDMFSRVTGSHQFIQTHL